MRNNNQENPVSKDKSPTSLIKNLLSATPSCRKAINFIIKLSCHYKNIYPSQEFIGQQIGVCRQTANEALKIAEEIGFLESTYYHRQTKSYRVAFFFSNPFIRAALLSLLPALSLFPIYGSLSSFSKKDDTNINYMNIKSNNYSSLYINTPYIPQMGNDGVCKTNKKLHKEKKEHRKLLIEEFGRRYKLHYIKETLKLYVYPTYILQEGIETLKGIIADGERVRSPFRYLRKILTVIMVREKKTPRWLLYYQKVKEVTGKEVMKAEKKEEVTMKPSPKFPNALLGKAKKIWEEAQQNKISKFKAKSQLAEFKKTYPEGLPLFLEWYNSPDGLGFRKWMTE